MGSARLESLTLTVAATRWFRIMDRFLFYSLETNVECTIIINSQLRRTSVTYRLAIVQHCSSKCRNVLCLMADAATLHDSATLIWKMAFISRHKYQLNEGICSFGIYSHITLINTVSGWRKFQHSQNTHAFCPAGTDVFSSFSAICNHSQKMEAVVSYILRKRMQAF